MPVLIDLTGKRFGRLIVLKRLKNIKPGYTRFLCRCDCGREKPVDASNLRKGASRSCGCLNTELMNTRRKTHGMTYTRIYRVWRGMIDRCEQPCMKHYHRYGGRGITVCEAWHKFENFYAWAMVNGYREGLTIERKENNGNYEPDNCKWATQKEQGNNRRTNRFIEFHGQRKTLSQWADTLNIKYSTLLSRLFKQKLPIDKAFSLPIAKRP